MKSVEAEGHIAASPDQVWAVITNAQALVAAQLGITELHGPIAAGAHIRLRSAVAPKQVFRLRVTAFAPPTHMVWQGGMPLGLFTGRRSFTLTPTAGGMHLHMREVFTGPLSGLIWKSMPDLTPSFATFIAGVARLAERKHA